MKHNYFLPNFGKAFLLAFMLVMLVPFFGSSQTNIAPKAIVTANGTGGAGCMTGACSTMNDLNFGSCGTQQMWISTSGPPSTTIGADWIQWDFPTPEAFDEIVIHHGDATGRFLSGALIQYWNGTSWVTHHHFTNLPMACISDIKFPKLVTSRFRLTAFEMTRTGQNSNPNFREVEVISAPTAYNDAMVMSIDSPRTFCAGLNDVYATIANYGLNRINSVEVHWEVNGVSKPVVFYGQLLDTMYGNFPNSAIIKLGSANFNAGNNTVKVFTSLPNGSTDGFPINDTVQMVIRTATAPAGLAFPVIGRNTVDVQVLGGSGSYEYEYGLKGFSVGSGIFASTNSGNFTLSGLNSSTAYDVYIRTNCGNGDVSSYVGPFSFYTSASIPFFQDFENFGRISTGIVNVEGWNSVETSAPNWQTGINTSSSATGPVEDQTIGTGGTFVFLETSGGTTGDFDSLISPPVMIDSSASSVDFEFYYHMHGTTMGSLEISMLVNGVSTIIDTIIGEQHPVQTDPWTRYYAQLSNLQGSIVQLVFKGIRGTSFTGDMAIDDVRLMKTPTCIRPSSLAATNVTTDSATFTWQENNIATQWIVEYGPKGFILGTGTDTLTTANPMRVGGLSASTNYEFYVKSICGRGDSSIYEGPFKFFTTCGDITVFPYMENFDGSLTNNVWNCWTVYNIDGGNTWNQANTYLTARSTPYVAHGMGNNNDFLISPRFSLPVKPMRLKFWEIVESSTQNNTYTVLVSTTGKDTADFTDTLGTFTATSTTWLERTLDLSAYANQNIYIAFWQTYSASTIYGFGIDDFLVEQIPSCAQPTGLAATGITSSSATLSWQENNIATEWLIQYGAGSFSPGMGIDTLVNTKPFTLGGLSANTTYQYYVKSVCGRNDSSFWAGPFTFVTSCTDVSSFPYTENFDGSTVNNVWNCWTVYDFDGGNTWNQANTYLTARSSPYVAHGMGNNNDMLISPRFNMPANPMWLKFWEIVESSSMNNTYSVLVSTTGKDSADFTDTLATYNVTSTTWLERTIDLSSYVNQNIYIAFWQSYSASTIYGFGIDDFLLEDIPSCLEPSNLSATNITKTTADLGWTENNIATEWEVEYDTSGFAFGSGNRVLSSSNPYQVSGLQSGRQYEFYVRSICGRGDTSFWAGPFQFMTLFPPTAGGMMPLPGYGNTYTGSARGYWYTAPVDFIITGLRVPTDIGLDPQNIHIVKFNAAPPAFAATTTAFTTLGYWSGVPGATIVSTSIPVRQGDIIGILGTRGTSSTNSYATPAGPFQSNILGQPVTLTRLIYQGHIHLNPAPEFSEEVAASLARVEMYYTPASNGGNNASTVSVDSLAGLCAGPQSVYATIKNAGTNQIDSVEVNWEVNGVSQAMVHHKQMLDTFGGVWSQEASVLLGSANFISGSNTVKVWTSMPNGVNDTINDNDTIVHTFFSPSAPTGVSFNNVTTNSVLVNVNGASGSVDYQYGPSGFLPGNGTNGSSASSSFSITGLNSNTKYDVYVRNNCGSGSSIWAGPFAVRTAIAIPYLQTFEAFGNNTNGINNIEGWNSVSTIDPQWETGTRTTSSATGPEEDHTIGLGGTFAYLETSGGTTGDFDSLISPPIMVDTGAHSLTVEFWYHMHGATMSDLEVYIDTNGVSNLLTTISGQQHTNQLDPWTQYSTQLMGYEGSSITLIFKGIRGTSFTGDMAVDDIMVMKTPAACAGVPDPAVISGPGSVCSGVPFTLNATNVSIGPGATHEWQYYDSASSAWIPTGSYGINENVQAGIFAATPYRFITYCSNSGQSDTTSTFVVGITPGNQCYCTAIYTTGCSSGDDIRSVIVNGENGTMINDLNTTCSPNNYDDKTNLPPVAVVPDEIYSAQINSNYGSLSEYAKVWIDFNNDGLFDNVSELVGQVGPFGPALVPFDITIPPGVQYGLHRMRVRSVWLGSGFAFDACSSESYGEVHDYMVRVLDLNVTNNAAVHSIDTIVAACPGSQNVYATVSNPGSNQIDSVEVHWEFNGVVQNMVQSRQLLDTLNGSLSNNAKILLGTVNVLNGSNNIKVWTSMPNGVVDTVNFDDTLSMNFTMDSKAGKLFGSTSLCLGDTASVFVSGHRGSVQWQESSGGAFTDIVGATGNSIDVVPNSTMQFRAVVCGSMVSDTLTVTPTSPAIPTAADSILTVVCGNSGQVALIATSPNPNAKFEWYSTATGGSSVRVGGNVSSISLYGDTLYYQANPAQGSPAVATFYVQEIVLSGSGICASTRDSATATIDCIVGIEGQTGETTSSISIHPNPSKGTFNIVGSGVKEAVEISIFNSNGKLVYQSANRFANNFDERIDISGLAKGLYFVKLQSRSSTEMKKVVVQ